MTCYSAQGQTKQRAFVLNSERMDQRLAYVAMTRHTDDVAVYVDKQAAHTQWTAQMLKGEWKSVRQMQESDVHSVITRNWSQLSSKMTTCDYARQAESLDQSLQRWQRLRDDEQRCVAQHRRNEAAVLAETKAKPDRASVETAPRVIPYRTPPIPVTDSLLKPDRSSLPEPDRSPLPEPDRSPLPEPDRSPLPEPDRGPLPEPDKPSARRPNLLFVVDIELGDAEVERRNDEGGFWRCICAEAADDPVLHAPTIEACLADPACTIEYDRNIPPDVLDMLLDSRQRAGAEHPVECEFDRPRYRP